MTAAGNRDVQLAARLKLLPDDALASPAEASALTGFAIVTLRRWRRDRRGPPFVLIEGVPRYRLGDLRSYSRGASNG